ncbi:sensor domain-containing phosphodiesterase [Desulfomicrobium norvegicum]|uniref:sensor domain-containing phosphodiesterase n=1 Tax=Desulfomicrobium norvegicum (strain DSM 1741 / NCIMB 8310) TaxID=52561 RepID=UPI00116087EE|nr:sensor domain-containing phosphodiesterase [Desulfomicrobium norvegicum]
MRRVSPDLDNFLFLLPVDSCIVICTSEQSVRNFLDALKTQAGLAGHRLALDGGEDDQPCRTPAPGPLRGDARFDAPGNVDSPATNLVSDEAGSGAFKICRVQAQRAPEPSAEDSQGSVPGRSGEQKPSVVSFTLVRPPLQPEALGALMISPAVIIDSEVYLRPDLSSASDRPAEATPSVDSVLDGFVEYHRLAQKNVFMEEILGHLETPVLAGYADGRVLGGNEAFLNLSGYSRFELATRNWTLDLASLDFQALQENVLASLLETGRTQELDTELQTSGGKFVPCHVRVYLHKDEKDYPLFFSAHYHPATDSPGSDSPKAGSDHTFSDSLQYALKRSIRHPDYAFAVLVMGIDNAEQVLLQIEDQRAFFEMLAKRTVKCLRTLDIPAYLDSEQFFMLLDNVPDVIGAVRVAQRIQEETARAFKLGQSELRVTCSFGVVMAPRDYTDEKDMLKDARVALGRALQRGERQIVIFDDRQNNEAVQFLRIESGLRNALLENEVCMHYQPIVHLQTGTICGVEAYMRWNHKRKGLLRAEWFLPFAEHSDVVFELEAWAVRKSCSALKRFQQVMGESFFLGLNVSLRNALRLGFIEELTEVVLEHGLRPEAIVLEVREEWLKYFGERFSSVFAEVDKAGVGIVVDHFDATHISLADLHHFPLRGLKLNVSLQNDPGVLTSLSAIAKSTGLTLIAPGVEDATRLCSLQEHGCTYAQGNALAPTMDEEALIGYLSKERE